MKKLLSDALDNGNIRYVGNRIFAASAIGRGDKPPDPKKPFLVFRELPAVALPVARDTSPNLCRRVFQVYVHDERGSYSRINGILDDVRETVRGLVSQVSSTGARCLDAEWNGTSAETEDPTYDTNMRFATFSLTSTK